MNKLMHPIEPEELMAYLDGELASDRTPVAAAHLNECAECRELVAQMRDVSETMKVWPVELQELTTPPAIATALEQCSQEPARIASNKKLGWREVFGVRWQVAEYAGLLALVLAGVVGAVRLIGGNANNVFSQVSSTMRDENPTSDRDRLALSISPQGAPAPASTQGKQFDSLQQFAKLSKAPSVKFAAPKPGESSTERESLTSGPMIIRTAELALITKDFDKARPALEAILKRHRGYIGELKVGGSTGSGRTLTATLRVPADQLDASLTELKTLGRVESESQSGQDVTSQYVDLQARLANARNTEQRLTDLLRQRTGKLSDVLEVEQEVDRVRGEIEQMEAERKNMSNQVTFATLNVTVAEDYKAQLQVVPPSTWTRLSNAAVAGYKNMVDGMVGLALFLLENIPSLLFWLALLFLPVRLVWKRVRRSFAQ
jgi:Flp pilus assembly pilin Flp